VIEGGSRIPSVPPAAMMPAAKPGEYPRLRISGMPAVPIAEHVAGLEPAIAANSAQVNTFAIPSPPGMRCSHACIARYRSRPASDRPIAAPLRMNSGIDSNVMLDISS
jgi:hypothetical protein